jgi:hypothetical protein
MRDSNRQPRVASRVHARETMQGVVAMVHPDARPGRRIRFTPVIATASPAAARQPGPRIRPGFRLSSLQRSAPPTCSRRSRSSPVHQSSRPILRIDSPTPTATDDRCRLNPRPKPSRASADALTAATLQAAVPSAPCEILIAMTDRRFATRPNAGRQSRRRRLSRPHATVLRSARPNEAWHNDQATWPHRCRMPSRRPSTTASDRLERVRRSGGRFPSGG